MSTTPAGPRRTVLIEAPYFFTNNFKQLPPLSTAPPLPSPLSVAPRSTPVSTCTSSTSMMFADSDGEADLSGQDSGNPDLYPRENLSFGELNKNAVARAKGNENMRRFRPVTPTNAYSTPRFPKEVF